MKKNRAFLILLAICLAYAVVIFSQIFFFRPLLFHGQSKIAWAAASLLAGILPGMVVFAIVRRIGSKIPDKALCVALMILAAVAAALLPGPHHPPVYPTSLTRVPLRITARPTLPGRSVTIANIFVNGKRVDWPYVCRVTGEYERTAGEALVLQSAGSEIVCPLFPPKAASQVEIDFGGGTRLEDMAIRLGDADYDGKALMTQAVGAAELRGHSVWLPAPLTSGIWLARVVEFLATLAALGLLLSLFWLAAWLYPLEKNPLAARIAQGMLALLLAGMVILTNLTSYAFINNIESKDAGVFLYTGQAILSGQAPYKAVWDHKPPLVFYLNALGLALGHGSAWGVWALEVLLLILSVWMLYQVLRRYAGAPGATVGVFLFAAGLFLLFRGDETNVPETWGIFFQAALLLVTDRLIDKKNDLYRKGAPKARAQSFAKGRFLITVSSLCETLRSFAVRSFSKIGIRTTAGLFLAGLLTGLCFLLKQVLAGAGIALVIVLLTDAARYRKAVDFIKKTAWFAAGAGLAIAAAIFTLWTQGALAAFWDAAFRYNMAYVGVPFSQIFPSLLSTLANPLWPVAGVAYAGWALGVYQIFRQTKRPAQGQPFSLVFLLALIAFPLEILLAAFSGKNFTYYANARLYCIAIIGGVLAGMLFQTAKKALGETGMVRRRERSAAMLGAIYLSLLAVIVGYSLPESIATQPSRNTNVLAIEYLRANTTQEDTILVWGNDAAVNFYTGRRSPTRFVYQYALFNCAYLDEAKAAEFYQALTAHPPKFIVDTFDPLVPSLETARSAANFSDWARQQSCDNFNRMWPSLNFIQNNYSVQAAIGRWKVYARR